jgi:hypothetical protein
VASIPAWLWLTVGWCTIGIGAWQVTTGRPLRLRHKGRRCSRCSYEMAGLPTLTCPECGRTAKNTRELSRFPRRLRWRFTGLLVISLGWAGTQTPLVLALGWAAAVPNWVLAYTAPTSQSAAGITATMAATPPPLPPPSKYNYISEDRFILDPPLTPPPAPPAPPKLALPAARLDNIHDSLYIEVWRRLYNGEMSGAAARAYLERVFSATGDDDDAFDAHMPIAWPADRPFRNDSLVSDPNNNPAAIMRTAVINPKSGGDGCLLTCVHCGVGNAGFDVHARRRPVDTSRTSADFMRPVTDATLDAAVITALAPTLLLDSDRVHVKVQERHATPEWDAIPCFLFYRIRLRVDGREIARGSCDASRNPRDRSAWYGAEMTWDPGAKQLILKDPGAVELELTGQPNAALNEFVNGAWHYSPVSWAGTVRIKPQIERR